MNRQLSPRARRRLRRAGLAGLGLAAALGLAWLALGLLFQGLLDRGRVARWSEARLEAALGRDVELGEVALSGFPRPEVALADLRIGPPRGVDAPPLARVDRVRLRVALWPLLRRRVVVEEAELSGAAIRVVALADGRSSLGGFAPGGGPERPSGRSPLSVRVREVRLEGGSVTYRRAGAGPELAARGVSGRARLGPGGDRGAIALEVRADSVRLAGPPGGEATAPLPVRIRLDGRLAEGGLALEDARASAGGVSLRISGRVDSVARAVRRVDLRVNADPVELAEAASLARRVGGGRPGDGGPELAGRLSVDLAVRGPWGAGRRPEVAGLASLREGRIGPAGEAPARELAGGARIDGDSVTLARLRGRLLGGEMEAAGALRLDSARSWRLRLRARPRLRRLAALRGADTTRLDGAVAADLVLRGRGGGASALRASGTLHPEDLAVARPGWSAPLRVPSGTVRLAGDSAVAEGLPLVAAADTLRLDLAVAGVPARLLRDGPVPTFDSALRGPRLDLDALLGAPPGDGETRSRLALSRLGGRPVEGRSAERLAAARAGLPDSAPAAGTLRVEVGELVRRPRRLTDVSARLELAPGRLEVAGADFGALGGRVRLSGGAGLGAAPAPFRLSVRAEGLEGGELLATSTPAGRLVTGRADLTLEASGRLDSLLLPLPQGLSGEGRLVFGEGRMRPNPVTSALAAALRTPALESPGFRRWEQPWTLRGDTLFLAPSAPEGLPLPLRLGGAVGLGGRLDLAVVGEVPAATARALAGRVGGLPGALLDRAAGGGPLPVALRLAGSAEDPRVELDAGALREALEGAARREAGEAARREAGSLLRRLLRRPGAPPADTAGAASDTTGAGRDAAGAAPRGEAG